MRGWNRKETNWGFTFQIDPQIVGVENLEFANLEERISFLTNIEHSRQLPDLKSSTCSEGT